MKNTRIFHLKSFHFLVVKFSVYLNRCVFVMVLKCENKQQKSKSCHPCLAQWDKKKISEVKLSVKFYSF